MTSYVAYYGKKREQLDKHERELIALIQKNAPASKLLKAAQVVRDAHIRVPKSRREQLPASETSAAQRAILNDQIQLWLGTSPETVLARYRSRPPEPKISLSDPPSRTP